MRDDYDGITRFYRRRVKAWEDSQRYPEDLSLRAHVIVSLLAAAMFIALVVLA